MNIFQKSLLKMIRFYQREISPHKEPSCIYYPSCSQYGIEAIQAHGAFKGVIMTFARIFRCHPFHKGGVDRVPTKFSLKRNPKDLDKLYIRGLGIFSKEELEQSNDAKTAYKK